MGQYQEPYGDDYPTLELYHKGRWVEYSQELLTRHGYPPQDHRIDGYYGPLTKEAVRDFQGHWGLETTGVIDAQTWALLEGTEA